MTHPEIGILILSATTVLLTGLVGWFYVHSLNRVPKWKQKHFENITFPLKRTDGPTQYDHAHIADANGIPIAYVLKRPAVGVDGGAFADFLIEACNRLGRNA